MISIKNYCSNCDKFIYYTMISSNDEDGSPIEEECESKYCPICGTRLINFNGIICERMYRVYKAYVDT